MTTLTPVEKDICEIIIFVAATIVTIICGMVDTSDCLLVGALIWLAYTVSLDMLVEVKDNEE